MKVDPQAKKITSLDVELLVDITCIPMQDIAFLQVSWKILKIEVSLDSWAVKPKKKNKRSLIHYKKVCILSQCCHTWYD